MKRLTTLIRQEKKLYKTWCIIPQRKEPYDCYQAEKKYKTIPASEGRAKCLRSKKIV